MPHLVRLADPDDAAVIGRLLYDFNREFDEPAPAPAALAERLRQLIEGGDTLVVLAGDGPDGLAVLRFRAAIWSSGLECYLAELYVAPPSRGQGVGRALMEAAMREARLRGADTMDIGVDEPDLVARRLYESLGFTNRAGGAGGPLMYVYERELGGAEPPASKAGRPGGIVRCAPPDPPGRATGRREPVRSGPAAPGAGVPRRTGATAARR